MNNEKVLSDLYNIVLERKENPEEGSYTSYLFQKGLDKILKKVGEESTEVIIAAKNSDSNELTDELCDLMYHLLVLMAEKDVSIENVYEELAERRKKIGNKKAERKEIDNL
ncbi:phosphoribosyl-ATP diphosphatase [Clostridium sediminicola]|uniref:phosphoribosyl-ATP diphosphatase n=1 Tax=Clostridium sediminicola TaxID=3114879 RepID=UPI0031F1CEE4